MSVSEPFVGLSREHDRVGEAQQYRNEQKRPTYHEKWLTGDRLNDAYDRCGQKREVKTNPGESTEVGAMEPNRTEKERE